MNNFNFVGVKKKKNYFEGWFLRVFDNEDNCYSFIFGISLNKNDPHSFIQIIDQNEKKSYYHKFNVSDFTYNNNEITIGKNILSTSKLKLSVSNFNADINIKPMTFLKNKLGVMGFFKYFFLPTRHEIIFMNSKIEGLIKNSRINGNGYMEKDLGTRFPKKWLWIQCNCFKKKNVSLVIAKANLISNIKGFFAFLNIGGKEYCFATYNCSKIENSRDKNNINLVLKSRKYKVKIELKYANGYELIAPTKKAKMIKKIEESLKSTLKLSLYEKNKLLFSDEGINVACEYLY